MTDSRRWDTDERGTGVATAIPMVPELTRLLDAANSAGWVTEDAYAHLGKHLRAACAEADSPWRWLAEGQGEDGVYVIDLRYDGESGIDVVRAAVVLLSRVAERSFYLRQVDDSTIDCITGQLAGDGPFATHGHTIRLQIQR